MIIGILIVGAIAVYIAACVLTGLAPTNTRLAGFTPQIGPINREYAQPADAVLRSYAEAARRTPGMSVVETTNDTVLIDLRPTTRIIGGNFGLAIRVRAEATAANIRVVVDARRKVAIAVFSNDHAALVQAERRLRMNAKQHGLTELVHEPGH